MMESFRAAGNMPKDYLTDTNTVAYSLKLAYYSQYAAKFPHKETAALRSVKTAAAKHLAAKPATPQKLVGWLDDETSAPAPATQTVAQAQPAPAKPQSAPAPAIQVESTLPWKTAQAETATTSPVQKGEAKIVLLKNESIQKMLKDNETLAVPPLHVPASAAVPMPDLSPATATGALSDQDKQIIAGLPAQRRKRTVKQAPVHIAHMQKNPLDNDVDVEKHTGVGIQISVRRPKVNVEGMLEQAYQNLLAGNQEGAIELYKEVLQIQPNNKLALFGLATTYHRAGQPQLARPLYGQLLVIDPNNVEGLNNYLVLLADEAPEEALVELGRLEKTHPDFSPIPAQMAIIYEKQGNYPAAVQQMTTAINLAPENLRYRYNMAIILDHKGDWENAAELYKELLTASERGEKIAADPDEIQQRLTFILSNKPKG
ncbi:MAG TPA: tetratricopeptide repeat protein [Rickettsiales bacterium]|nr:tetratricopeptide repeat protein [Rickettsiales bacterium]